MDLYLPQAANIVKLHDGDTYYLDVYQVMLTEAFWLPGLPLHPGDPDRRYRTAEINAPELATPEGKASLAALAAFLGPLPVACFIGATQSDKYVKEKYGRTLCHVAVNGVDLGQWMLTNGWAVPYASAKA